jgi:HJR/Mrr/RecB family endonuclease
MTTEGYGSADSKELQPSGALQQQALSAKQVSFDNLDDVDFEEFCFELLSEIGFVNVDWRKGTAKRSSPSDRGRDIVAYHPRVDVDGHQYLEEWFVDTKHYKRGVPPEALQTLFTWAEAEHPSVALVIASGYLSNPAKDWIEQYKTNRKPPFRVRVWERPAMSRMLARQPELMQRHDITVAESMRSLREILAAEREFFDRVWYVRKLVYEEHIESGAEQPTTVEIMERMQAGMRAVEDRYGADTLTYQTDWDWGVVNGKLSTLRWILGSDWDELDT